MVTSVSENFPKNSSRKKILLEKTALWIIVTLGKSLPEIKNFHPAKKKILRRTVNLEQASSISPPEI